MIGMIGDRLKVERVPFPIELVPNAITKMRWLAREKGKSISRFLTDILDELWDIETENIREKLEKN